MKKHMLLAAAMGLSFLLSLNTQAQQHAESKINSTYRATATKINNLVHTKLDVRFDYAKRYLYGKAWITLKPHFYTTDTLTLDAKGMDLKMVALVGAKGITPLKYTYDQEKIYIQLNKKYVKDEKYTVFIEYVSKPNELKASGSAAITDEKGLYFINPDGAEKDKPIQIWTQGEAESSSASYYR
jgi:aminopeptidase N